MDIECEFEKLDQWSGLVNDQEDERLKLGRYESTLYTVEGIGMKCWPVVANILTNPSPQELLESGLTEEEIISQCFEKLNTKPYRARKLKYGELTPRHYIFKEDKISVSFVTTDRNNKHFWGRGEKGKKIGKRKKAQQ